MPSLSDVRIVSQRSPRGYLIEEGFFAERGLKDARPKKLDNAKAVATLVRQVARQSSHTVKDAFIMTPPSVGDLESLFGYLSDFSSVNLAANYLPVFLDHLTKTHARTAVVIAGEAHVPRDDGHAFFARSLVGLSRRLEDATMERLLALAREAETSLRGLGSPPRLIVQEKPGKFSPLDLAGSTLKLQMRRFQASLSKSDESSGRPPQWGEDGFGLGALVIVDDSEVSGARMRRVKMASADVRFSPVQFGLSTGPAVAAQAKRFLSEVCELSLASLKRIVLSTPAPVVAGHLIEAFERAHGQELAAVFAMPDLQWGWQPTLTLMELLATGELPVLFVATGRYPLVHFVAIWSEA